MSSGIHKNDEWENIPPKTEKELEKYGVWVKSGPKDIPAEDGIGNNADFSENNLNDLPDFSFLDNSENIAFENTGDKENSETEKETSNITFSDTGLQNDFSDFETSDEDVITSEDDFSIDDLKLNDLDLTIESSDNIEDSFESTSFTESAGFEESAEKLDIDSSVFAENAETFEAPAFEEENAASVDKDFSIDESLAEEKLESSDDIFAGINLNMEAPAFEEVSLEPENSETTDFGDIFVEGDTVAENDITAAGEVFTEETAVFAAPQTDIFEEQPEAFEIAQDSSEKAEEDPFADITLAEPETDSGFIEEEAESEVFDDDNLASPIQQIMEAAEEPAAAKSGLDEEKTILQKIAAELSLLHNEFTSLKKEIESLKELGFSHPVSAPIPEDLAKTIAHDSAAEQNTGFFSADVEDEAIALSGDELNNILANADFTEEVAAETAEEQEAQIPETEIETAAEETPEAAEIAAENTAESAQIGELPDDDLIDESIFEIDASAKIAFDEEKLEEPSLDNIEMPHVENDLPEEINIDLGSDILVASEEEEEMPPQTLEEQAEIQDPVLEETFADEAFEQEQTDAPVPSTIEDSLDDNAKPEDPLFIDSIDDEALTITESEKIDTFEEIPAQNEAFEITEEENEIILTPPDMNVATPEDPIFDEADAFKILGVSDADETVDSDPEEAVQTLSEDNISYLKQEEPFNQINEITEDEEDLAIPTETVFQSEQWDEPQTETELCAEAESVEVPVIEAAQQETPDGLKTDTVIPQDLKYEIKSVLRYMDQLLENLPEDKIAEFACSEHFDTYKKLFKELGLS